ncbi:MAG: CRISPR-associated endonuclease Cas3'' [Planctomycetia bacterium]
MQYYAHTKQGYPPGTWEPLEDHLALVAKYCSAFADSMGASEFGRTLGLWHDLGKYSQEFQAYLHRENGYEAHIEQYVGRVDHSTAGAQLAQRLFDNHPYGRIFAYGIVSPFPVIRPCHDRIAA